MHVLWECPLYLVERVQIVESGSDVNTPGVCTRYAAILQFFVLQRVLVTIWQKRIRAWHDGHSLNCNVLGTETGRLLVPRVGNPGLCRTCGNCKTTACAPEDQRFARGRCTEPLGQSGRMAHELRQMLSRQICISTTQAVMI